MGHKRHAIGVPTKKGVLMNDRDLLLIGRAIDGLEEAQAIVDVLVNRGALPISWREIESVLHSIGNELSNIEKELISQTNAVSSV
jgi:hypothetical protein